MFLAPANPSPPATLDPWMDMYLPAWLGDEKSLEAALSLLPGLPPGQAGDGWAVAARALMVAGQPREAERRFRHALGRGGTEVEELRALREHDEGWMRLRIQRAPTAGERGDAACDLAAMRMERGDVPGAREAVRDARHACLDHLEAARWMRFLTDCPDPARRWKRPGKAHPWVHDVEALRPTPRNGWVGEERLRRRKSADRCPPPEGSAARRLWNAGAMGYWFALAEEYTLLDAGHPLIGLELRGEALLARVGEGRKVLPLAEALWRRVRGDELNLGDAAQLLVTVATMDRGLAGLAAEAATALVDREPTEPLWRAYRGWHRLGSGAADFEEDAWRAVAADADNPLAWYFGVCTFAHGGFEGRARGLAQGRIHDPILGGHAAELLSGATFPTPIALVSPRVRPKLCVAPAEA